MIKLSADPQQVYAIAFFRALYYNDFSLMEKLKQEAIELWNGDGI